MYICSRCDNRTTQALDVCDRCGAPMIEQAQTLERPSHHSTQHAAAQVHVTPAPAARGKKAGVSKGKEITGMALSIFGTVLATVGMSLGGVASSSGGMAALVICLVMSVYSLPLSLVGLLLSKKCRRAENCSKSSKLGVVFGMIGLILSGCCIIAGIAMGTGA